MIPDVAPFPVGSSFQGASPKGVRYTMEQKQEVVDFVNAHNALHGRGGQSEAARRFNLSLLTVAAWLKKSSISPIRPRSAARSSERIPPEEILQRVGEYMELSERIKNAEAEIAQLRAKHESLAARIRQSI